MSSGNTMITILHLSDLHFRAGDKLDQYNRQVVMEELLRDIAERTSRIGAMVESIDLIVISGDLAFSGDEEEYSQLERELLDSLSKSSNIAHDRLFTVPGNHDVDRSQIGEYSHSSRPSFVSRNDISDVLLDDERTGSYLRR